MFDRPLVTYAICCTSRSGSTYLCQLLESTGRLGKPNEYFNHGGEPRWRKRLQLAPNGSLKEYLDAVLIHQSSGGVFGVKAPPSSLIRFLPLFQPQKYILLRRRDTLQQAVSLYRAKTTGRYGCDRKLPPPPKDVPFDSWAIFDAQRQIREVNAHWETLFNQWQVEPLRVWYEDVCDDPMREVHRVAEFLGVWLDGIESVSARVVKVRDEITEEFLRRVREVHSSLQTK